MEKGECERLRDGRWGWGWGWDGMLKRFPGQSRFSSDPDPSNDERDKNRSGSVIFDIYLSIGSSILEGV
jgi:hypothetical protein